MNRKTLSGKTSFQKQVNSFRYAFQGIWFMIKSENHFRIHLIILVMVVIAGILFHLSTNEWVWIILVSGAVLSAETMNSSIEQLTDLVHPHKGEKAARIKDLAAGAVLLSAIAAAIAGVIIFAPKILALL